MTSGSLCMPRKMDTSFQQQHGQEHISQQPLQYNANYCASAEVEMRKDKESEDMQRVGCDSIAMSQKEQEGIDNHKYETIDSKRHENKRNKDENSAIKQLISNNDELMSNIDNNPESENFVGESSLHSSSSEIIAGYDTSRSNSPNSLSSSIISRRYQTASEEFSSDASMDTPSDTDTDSDTDFETENESTLAESVCTTATSPSSSKQVKLRRTGILAKVLSSPCRTDSTLYVGNLDAKVTEEILYELFLQATPVDGLKFARDSDGQPRGFAFVDCVDIDSAIYAKQLLNGVALFGRNIRVDASDSCSTEVKERLRQLKSLHPRHIHGAIPSRPTVPPQTLARRINSHEPLLRPDMLPYMASFPPDPMLGDKTYLTRAHSQLHQTFPSSHPRHPYLYTQQYSYLHQPQYNQHYQQYNNNNNTARQSNIQPGHQQYLLDLPRVQDPYNTALLYPSRHETYSPVGQYDGQLRCGSSSSLRQNSSQSIDHAALASDAQAFAARKHRIGSHSSNPHQEAPHSLQLNHPILRPQERGLSKHHSQTHHQKQYQIFHKQRPLIQEQETSRRQSQHSYLPTKLHATGNQPSNNRAMHAEPHVANVSYHRNQDMHRDFRARRDYQEPSVWCRL